VSAVAERRPADGAGRPGGRPCRRADRTHQRQEFRMTSKELHGRTAVVTGASKGIGLAIAGALARAGATVVAGSRTTSEGLDALVKEGAVTWVPVDLTEPEAAGQLVAAAGPRLDVLVNNVGSAPARTGGFLSVTDEDWRRSVDLNLLAAVRVTRAALPLMLAARSGSVITVGSVNATLPDPLVIDYSAGKAALVAFSKALSKEVGPQGVRVNTVSPGPVETELWLGDGGVANTVSAAAGLTPEQVVAQAAGATVTGRFSTPAEVADLVLFLAGDRAGNITGSDLLIDGGFIPTW
jgi:NAD(P)-dependent dehydrogenase (short-subunit alcohol dehydrogenase family)